MKSMEDQLLSINKAFPLRPSFCFSENQDDEFVIQDNEKILGIFKIWPNKVLDILEGDKLNTNHIQRMTALKKWLTFISLQDLHLQKTFHNTSISDNTVQRAGELFSQLEQAFSRFEPFYNIEAMVDNRKNISTSSMSPGGEIDLVALMLPAIYGPITSHCGNWAEIQEAIDTLRSAFNSDPTSPEGKKFTLLALIARKLGISLSEGLFASKVLSFIHKNPEGSAEEIDLCIDILKKSYRRNIRSGDVNSVDADINARIRFMNWLPIEKDEGNFSGKHMNYDAVCERSSLLFALVSENPLLISEEHREWFTRVRKQLVKLDASSARGRFLLQMYIDKCFSQELCDIIDKTRQRTLLYIVNTAGEGVLGIKEISDDTNYVDLQKMGGKGLGISLAREVFGTQAVAETQFVGWTDIHEWLLGMPDVKSDIALLQDTKDVNTAILIGKNIAEKIEASGMPATIIESLKELCHENSNKIILRSSALTEDIEDVGSAPGIYESYRAGKNQMDPATAFKKVVSSFFSEKAIIFRHSLGLCHTPLIAVLAQPFFSGKHGSLFVTQSGVEIDISASNINILDHETHNTILPLNTKDFRNAEEAGLFDMAKKAYTLFGATDMEFIIQENRIVILQLRMLDHKNNEEEPRKMGTSSKTIPIGSVDELIQIDPVSLLGKEVHLIFSKDINFNKFQELLSIHIIRLSQHIHCISLPVKIASTSHFSNIIRTLGIELCLPD